MPQVARIIGGAGTGKTSHLLKLMEWWLTQDFMDANQIGFVSFTKAARREASTRAAAKFHTTAEELEKNGWFKTLHACCYKLLKTKSSEILTDTKADKLWVSEAIGESISGTEDPDDSPAEAFAGNSAADIALAIWGAARNRLAPLEEVWLRASHCDERTPALEFVRQVVAKYEQAKRLDNRSDYTDVLGRYSGWAFNELGMSARQPEGYVPEVPVWFLDEAQDNSALTDAVARRLVSSAKWVYVVADPFQSIYQWSGADPKHFFAWQASPGHERTLPQTFRCPAPIHELGEQVLRECSDYWDRKILPAPHAGEVSSVLYREPWLDQIDPSQQTTWLLLARTNFLAQRLAKRLDARGIPWLPVKGHGGKWAAPVRATACKSLLKIEGGYPISVFDWQCCLKHIPSKHGGKEMLKHGTKKEWDNYSGEPHDLLDPLLSHEWGVTPELMQLIKAGKWKQFVEHSEEFCAAWKQWGPLSVLEPRVRVGTIHAVKGMEADNVLLLTTTTHQVMRSAEDQAGRDEELRVWYVGVTRARRKLIIAREHDAKFCWELPL